MSTRKPSDTYSPLYFLASVGAGGLTVTFFMWLMFWIPHPGKTVPVFEDIMAAFAAGNPATQAMLVIAMAGIAFFAFQNIKLLIWNLQRYTAWRKTEAFEKFAKTNAQSQMLALPLALAMAVNGGFIIGLVFRTGPVVGRGIPVPVGHGRVSGHRRPGAETIWCVSGPCADRRWL